MKKATITFLFPVAFCTFSVLTLKGMDTNIQEVWKEVVGYEGYYQVSNLGRVKQLEVTFKRSRIHHHDLKIIRTHRYSNDYLFVILLSDKQHSRKSLHRLVAEHFIDNPFNLPEVNHKNGIKTDNRASELEWSNRSNNTKHAYDVLGRAPYSSGKKAIAQYDLDGSLISKFPSIGKAVKQLGIARVSISNCCNGKSKKAGNYKFSFL